MSAKAKKFKQSGSRGHDSSTGSSNFDGGTQGMSMSEIPFQLVDNTSGWDWEQGFQAIQMVGNPNEFETNGKLADHFHKHVTVQGDAGGHYTNQDEYEAAAKAIAEGDYTETKTRADGANCYWKASTGQFVVVKNNGVLTLFVPAAGKTYYDNQ